jgi:hypothetical protein
LSMNYKTNWAEAKQRFTAWWAHQNTDRPMMNLWAYRDEPLHELQDVPEFNDDIERYTDVGKIVTMAANEFSVLEPLAEAMPSVSLNLGAGSMALYLGCEPDFRRESVWFEPCLAGYDSEGTVSLNAQNKWLVRHLEMYRQARALLKDTDILLDVPDLVENLDIISAMRGPQQTCYDMYDYPEEVKKAIWKINEYYKPCYDAFNEICHSRDGSSSFTAFGIWGSGRTAKVQCDHSAMISPGQFREFVQEPLRRQCRWLDNAMYHLDGPDCICHVKALMEIEELNALQWTNGDGNPLPGDERWDVIYRQVKDAGKGMWVNLTGYVPDVAVEMADGLVKKFGGGGFYFFFPTMDRAEADALLIKADREWKERI